jgi:hypothetical protein
MTPILRYLTSESITLISQRVEGKTYWQEDLRKAVLKRLSSSLFQEENSVPARFSGFRGQIAKDFHKKFAVIYRGILEGRVI